MEAWNEADVGSCSFMTELARTDGTKKEKLNGGLGMGVWEWGSGNGESENGVWEWESGIGSLGMGVWDWS